MKYVKTFENFEYNNSVNEEFLNLFKTNRDKMKKALDAVLNSPKAKELGEKFYNSLPDKDKQGANKLFKKIGNKTDEQLEEELLGEADQATAKKPEEVDKLDKELKTTTDTTTTATDENYKFDSDVMINEELNFKLMFDKFITKLGFLLGGAGVLGSALVFFTTCAGAASSVFAPLYGIVIGILGPLAPVIALIVCVIGLILIVRKVRIITTRHPATGERCKSTQEMEEEEDWRDYYDKETDRFVFPSIPDKSFHVSQLKGVVTGADGETYPEYWKKKFDEGKWDGKDKLGKLVPEFAKSESLNSRMKSFKKF